eukprot:TRINITY_DN26863_c0_g1_i3.p2 TRINITY_DN26863_c0_g1~~TRINITY_DN26863_c0_g1_i3.p2  ORF type:complete len:368 (+),score=70.02 TRINITY_DN26863_c0_g1_i3:843-1946(+)
MTPPRSAAIARAAPAESVLAPLRTGQPPQPRPHQRPAETRQVRARRGARRSSQAAPPPRRASPPPTPVLSDGDADWAEGRTEVAAGLRGFRSAVRGASRRAWRAAPSQRRPPVPELSAAADAWSSQQVPLMPERSALRTGTPLDCTAPHLRPAPVPPPRLDGSPGNDVQWLPVARPVFPPPPHPVVSVCSPRPLPASGGTAVLADHTPAAERHAVYAVPLTPAPVQHHHLPRVSPAAPLGGPFHPVEHFAPPVQVFSLQDGFSAGWASAPLLTPLQCAAAPPSAPPPEVVQLVPQPLPKQPAQPPLFEQPPPAAPGQSEAELCTQQQQYAPCSAPASAPDTAARHHAASGDSDGEQEDGVEGFIAYL